MKRYSLILTTLLVSACADNGYNPIALDANYGRSVRQVTQAQYLNPQAAAKPSTKVYTKLDGQAGQNIMNGYRQSFSQSNSNQNEGVTTVNIGSFSSSGSSGSSGN
jgi:hypothetical protein